MAVLSGFGGGMQQQIPQNLMGLAECYGAEKASAR